MTPNEFALEDRVTALEQKSQDDSYIVVEQRAGMTDDLNRVQAYGPFATEEEAEKFVSKFSYGRATRGLSVTTLKAS